MDERIEDKFWKIFSQYAKALKDEKWKGKYGSDSYHMDSKGAMFLRKKFGDKRNKKCKYNCDEKEFFKMYKNLYGEMWNAITDKGTDEQGYTLYFTDDTLSDYLRYAFFMGRDYVHKIINDTKKMAKSAHKLQKKLCSGKIRTYPYGYSPIDFFGHYFRNDLY